MKKNLNPQNLGKVFLRKPIALFFKMKMKKIKNPQNLRKVCYGTLIPFSTFLEDLKNERFFFT